MFSNIKDYCQIWMLNNINSSKRGQIGETMTWVVATIIIIFILVTAIFFANLKINGDKKILIPNTVDALASNSFFSYLLTKDTQGNNVYSQLQEAENLDDFNGNLAIGIFEMYFGNDYVDVWLGLRKENENSFLSSVTNDYFKPEKGLPSLGPPNIFQEVFLNDEKSISIILTPFKLPGLGGFG